MTVFHASTIVYRQAAAGDVELPQGGTGGCHIVDFPSQGIVAVSRMVYFHIEDVGGVVCLVERRERRIGADGRAKLALCLVDKVAAEHGFRLPRHEEIEQRLAAAAFQDKFRLAYAPPPHKNGELRLSVAGATDGF